MSDFGSRIAQLSPEKRALLTKRLREAAEPAPAGAEPLAIVGVGCRFPGGANTPEAFWRVISQGVDGITETPADRWSLDELYDPDPSAAGKSATRWGGFVDAVDQFDCSLFGIAPREAVQMDPQQRLLLETVWSALEHAGLAPDRLKGSNAGVFVGAHSHSSDYCWMQYRDLEALDAFSGTGTAHNFLSGRLSYFFDIHGPSLVVDTACSSSLVAFHLACQSIRQRECSIAIVAGVNLILSPQFTVAASRMHMLSPDGRCKSFDASANGFVRSEGCGAVIVKRLADAQADGDRVLAVVRGSAINQDGRTNGITAPNGLSQRAVIQDALRNAGVNPQDVSYVEAHGTGTPLGDPIEVEALAAVVGQPDGLGRSVALGSVKSNIGHLEGAAGITGLIKTVLCLQHRSLPGIVHFTTLNPHISLQGTALRIPRALEPWNTGSRARIAGVSSFGWSGTNAHVVLEEAPAREAVAAQAPLSGPVVRLIPLSAATPEALQAAAIEWGTWSAGAGVSTRMADVCHTAAYRRSHHDARAALIVRDHAELRGRVDAIASGQPDPLVLLGRRAERRGVVFVFPGQGSQWIGMGRELYASEPVFREAIDRCGRALSAFVDWSLVEQIAGAPEQSRFSEIHVVQPTLFSIEVALAALWRSWGVEPDAVVGHSMGEVAAAHVAGALSLEDAARVICLRSQLLRRVSGRGGMAAVELSLEETAQAIAGYEKRLSIAVSNSPNSTVISGDVDAIDEVLAALRLRDVFCRPIKVDVASHSPQVDSLRDDLVRVLQEIRPRVATVPIYSTVTASIATGAELDAEYWARNLRQPVLLSKTVEKLSADGSSTFIEMSPHPILLPAIETGLRVLNDPGLVLPSLRREEPEREVMLTSAGRLYVAGYELAWKAINGEGAVVDLPSYPFQRERYWLAEPASSGTRRTRQQGHAFLGTVRDVIGGTRTWDAAPDGAGVPAFSQSRFDGRPMLAPAVCLDAALEAARVAQRSGVSRLEFERPIVPAEDGHALVVSAHAVVGSGGALTFQLLSQIDGGPLTTNVVASLEGVPAVAGLTPQQLAAITTVNGECIDGGSAYERLARAGWEIGDAVRAIAEVRFGAQDVIARFEMPAAARGSAAAFVLPPSIGQACLDVAMLAAAHTARTPAEDSHVPLKIESIARGESRASSGWIVARPRTDGEAPAVDVMAFDDRGESLVSLRGVELLHRAADTRDLVVQRMDDWLFELAWQALPALDQPARASSPGNWLVLADDRGVGQALAASLIAGGHRATIVSRQEQGSVTSVVEEALRRASGRPLGVVHLWSLDLPSVEPDGADAAEYLRRLEVAMHANTTSVLLTVQAIARVPDASSAKLWIVTRGAQPVAGPMNPEGPVQAPVWGLGRVIAEEHLESWGGLVDLDPAADPTTAATALEGQIQRPDGERQVAFRAGSRYGVRYTPLRSAAAGVMPRFSPDASYLVTGGFGGVGFAAARWMAEHGARRLVLAGRTALPVRSQWSSVDPRSSEASRVAAIRTLESLGVAVHVAALDIGDPAALAAFCEGFSSEGWPPIRGIVHSAVVIEDGLVRDLNPASFATVMRPKVSGSWLLHRLFENQPLDFFVLFSSLGSVLGQTGQANYAAANAFLDALAHYRRGRGLPAISINWGGWREAGLGAASAGARLTIKNLESEGVSSFTTAQGLDVLGRLMQEPSAQALVMPVNWARFRRSHWATSDPLLFSSLLAAQAESAPAAPAASQSFRVQLLETEPSRRQEVFERYLVTQLAQVLRFPVSRIDPARPMGQLGLESLMALEFRNRLESGLGLKLSATVVWNHPTVQALARHLASRMEISFEPISSSEPREETAPVLPPSVSMSIKELSEEEALRALTGAADPKAR